MKRKIAAIIAADVAGYSKLMAVDEENTFHRLEAARAVFDETVARHGGRIFNTAGDAVLAEFASAVEAVRCALEIQESLRTKNLGIPEENQLRFRLGINLGDVIERQGDLLGDGVNIAARLEGLAEPGGICVSRAIYEQVENKLSIGFASIGPQQVKNIPNPIHVYRVSGAKRGDEAPAPVMGAYRLASIALVAGAALMAMAVAGAAWLRSPAHDPAPTAVVAKLPPPSPAPLAAPVATGSAAPIPAPIVVADVPPPIAPADTPAHAGSPPPRKTEAPAPAPWSNVPGPVSFDVLLSCEKLAWTIGPLNQTELTFVVRNGAIDFNRPIRYPTLQSPVIGVEIGRGSIDANGVAVVTSSWSSQRRSFKARYEGTLTARGGQLAGIQDWISEGRAYKRSCVIRLTSPAAR